MIDPFNEKKASLINESRGDPHYHTPVQPVNDGHVNKVSKDPSRNVKRKQVL